MAETSKTQELLLFLQNEYIENGYLNSGSWSFDDLRGKGFAGKDIDELMAEDLIQKRNCDGAAFELPVLKRHQLLSAHALCSRWLEKAGESAMNAIQAEARAVSLVKQSVHNAELITVDTLKIYNDERKPNKMDVRCPLAVGQVIQLEYDLPRKMGWNGNSYSGFRTKGTAVGEFMITDIYCNLLVDPPINMIELQSLSKEFNQIQPDARAMQVFEDVVMKRIKENTPSLEDKIYSAAAVQAELASDAGEGRTEKDAPGR